MKVLTTDNVMTDLIAPDGLKLLKLDEEHEIVEVDPDKAHLDVRSCVEIIPSHGHTTVNPHDRYYLIQDERLVDVWDISGRGKSQ
jgi:D-serine deaminase-like pyridoxal phosphate-dependent protein